MRKGLLKRAGAIVLALSVVMSMGAFGAFAADADKTISVTGVESGATVTAYQIVKEGNGAWETVSGVTIADVKAPTAAEITAIAKNAGSLTGIAMTESSGTYSATVDPGMYLVLVTGSVQNVYNPMIVSADYDSTTSNSLSAKTNFTNNAYAKCSEPGVEKKVVDAAGAGNDSGSSVEVGSVVKFQAEADIPSYSAEYEAAKLTLTDTLPEGITYNEDAVAKVGTTTVGTVSTSGNGFTWTWDSLAEIQKNQYQKVVIEYSGTVNENAKFNFDPNTNKASFKYTTDPQGNNESTPKEGETHTYTFGLDAAIGGTMTTKTQKTHELIKIEEDGSATLVDTSTDFKDITSDDALENAVFTLTSKNTGKVFEATSDGSGALSFTGLAEGEYTLKEKTAPKGYALSEKEYAVVIAATYNGDGTLASYTVTIDGTVISKFECSYEANGDTVIEPTTQDFLQIENGKTPGLPSTGGAGTYIFTVLGVIIMALGAMKIFRKFKSTEA